MPANKPYVAVAACCDKVLWERDGVLSAIRIVDTYGVPPDQPTGAQVAITVLVSLKSGDLVGAGELSLVLQAPDGKQVPLREKWPMAFGAAEQGANVIVNMALPAQKLGLYWLDVLWNEELLTKIPIKLALAPSPSALAAQQRLQ